ncbi:MAG: hypothetical protein DRP01_00090 [Archaeoglobales archaeon]|nr:MAG: hypothetical protein DRP01_00090 [Archaeoglobales archaeon]
MSKFEISALDALRYNATGRRPVVPGKYTRLVRLSKIPAVVMSDTLVEREDHQKFIDTAYGTVLVNGLGLGLCIAPLMSNPDVLNVVVVEKSKDVISLVSPTYRKRYPERLEIVHADAYTYEPETPPDVVWNDIWDTICADNLAGMDELEAKYCDADWCESWCRERCESLAARWAVGD